MQPNGEHRDIWDIALGFMDAQILLTAERLGVFDTLAEGAASADEVARAADLPADSAMRLLSGLCALGVARRDEEGRYVNTPEADAQLVKGRPGYIGSMFQHVREDLYPLWQHFGEALAEGENQWARVTAGEDRPGNEKMFEDPEALRSFMEGMHAISYHAASELAPQVDEMHEVDHLVDVGGASGAFVIAMAEEYPGLRGTVYDLPPVQPITEDFFRQHGMNGRVGFHPGDFWTDDLPEGADAYSLGFILHDWNEEGGSILLEKIASSIRPGGLLIIGEFLFNDDRTGPRHVARQDLNMLVAAQGRERSAEEYGDWIGEFGFALERIVPTSHGKHFLIARH